MKNWQKITSLLVVITICILGLICMVSAVVFSLATQKIQQEKGQQYVTNLNASFTELWKQSDIEMADGIGGPGIFAENGIIYFVGRTSDTEGIIALNAFDPGTVVWRRKLSFLDNTSHFFVNSSGLYTGTTGDPKITAYDLQTGETKWTIILRNPPTRGMSSLYETDGKVYVGATYNYILDSGTGELLAHSAMQSTSKEPFPQYFLRELVYRNNYTILYRWEPGYSSIRAIDYDKDVDLWEVNDAASNPVLLNEIIYYLTTDGKLVGVNADTGEFIHSLQFDSPSLGSIAVDQSTGIIYVWLQDSNQLFAFKIVDHTSNQKTP